MGVTKVTLVVQKDTCVCEEVWTKKKKRYYRVIKMSFSSHFSVSHRGLVLISIKKCTFRMKTPIAHTVPSGP
jgi:hypothetical protein